jgi:RimJ/RimL family protein N-acetyltransferase
LKRIPDPNLTLTGKHTRLEPLDRRHTDYLVAAAAADPSLYQWSPVPQGTRAVTEYIETAVASREAGRAVPFAIVRMSDGLVIGSTRFWNLDRWSWPQSHPRHDGPIIDGCEIGYTWLTRSAIRTAVNTEIKFLMLTHAFEEWRALRVCLHTDARNTRSAAAIERIGGKFEGILRAHCIAADNTARNSMRFSILHDEWPSVGRQLRQRMHPDAPLTEPFGSATLPP